MASSPMKAGIFPSLPFLNFCGKSILHGIGGFCSKIFSTFFILSCFIVFGVSPDCLMIVKKACSLGLRFLVISLISSFSMFLLFMGFASCFCLVSFLNGIVP